VDYIYLYFSALFSYWWFDLFWLSSIPLVLDLALEVLAPGAAAGIGRYLDPKRRRLFFAVLAMLGLLIAGFLPWNDQYRLAANLAQRPAGRETVSAAARKVGPQWESLPPAKVNEIASQLRSAGGSHQFRILYNCADNCGAVIEGLRQSLRVAGWREHSKPAFVLYPIVRTRGIVVNPPAAHGDDSGSKALLAALQHARLPVTEKYTHGVAGDRSIELLVGPKPK
jgi:hypothetical protein